MATFDSPWKNIIETYFEEFMAFFFPQFHKLINWKQEVHFLDKELQQLFPDSEQGVRYVDKLIQVHCLNGKRQELFIHIEIQNHKDPKFPKRVFVYWYRLFDLRGENVVSLALLTDRNPNWRPNAFHVEMADFIGGLKFPIFKLTDLLEKKQELENDPRIFAWVALAHLETMAAKGDPKKLFAVKKQLYQLLKRKGLNKDRMIELVGFWDWLIVLPAELEKQFGFEMKEEEGEELMQYVPRYARQFFEEEGIKKGIEQGAKKSQDRMKSILLLRYQTMLDNGEIDYDLFLKLKAGCPSLDEVSD